jgi:hypothetical protein
MDAKAKTILGRLFLPLFLAGLLQCYFQIFPHTNLLFSGTVTKEPFHSKHFGHTVAESLYRPGHGNDML